MSYNIFNQAHQPLKLALISGCTSLSTNNGKDAISMSRVVTKIEEVLKIFAEQLQYEATQILPLIFEYEPSVWAMFTSQHHKANNMYRRMRTLVNSFHYANESEKLEAIDELKVCYNEFVLYNFHHMDHEEPVLNEILWRYYKDSFIIMLASAKNEVTVAQHKTTETAKLATAA